MFIKFLRHFVSNPWVYDWVQYLFGFKQSCRRLAPYLSQTDGQFVLDVGAGTGNFAQLLPPSTTYLWLDCDLQKLRGFKTKRLSTPTILSNAVKICLRDKSVDYALCIALAHHLPDTELTLVFDELVRVVRQKVIFLDPVKCQESIISNLLWKYDRGSYPRSIQTLCSVIEPWFEIEHMENYTIYHHYLLWIGKPRVR